jgi:glycosyltransferase involved in cell wall biosynthesis
VKRKKILYFISEDWYFCSHRFLLAVAAIRSGYDVSVVTQVSSYRKQIEDAGIRLINLPMSRRSLNIFKELVLVVRLVYIYKSLNPNLVHHVALKPSLYGTIAARICNVSNVVNAFAGMGWIFSSYNWVARLLKFIAIAFIKLLLAPSEIIVQNNDDKSYVERLGCRSVHLIRGSGIDLDVYPGAPAPTGQITVILIARMLFDKGVFEYVHAAKILKNRGSDVRFLLVGAPDDQNPASISLDILDEWKASGVVEWLGHRDDIPNLLAESHIVCLPSYREGLPKSLLEGLATGRPIVTTDVPGCRETVREGINGFLVPPRDALALADALEKLILDGELRKSMGRESRLLAVSEFSSERIIAETLAVYSSLIGAGHA